jgi:hypothetical protein
MKIIGKTKENFLCELSRTEMKEIILGDSDRQMNTDDIIGTEVKIHDMFLAVREIELFKVNSEYDAVRTKITSLLKALSPIEGFILTARQKIKMQKFDSK